VSVESLQKALDKFPYKEFHYDPSVINPWIKDFTRKFATYRASLELPVDKLLEPLNKNAHELRWFWTEKFNDKRNWSTQLIPVETVTALLVELFRSETVFKDFPKPDEDKYFDQCYTGTPVFNSELWNSDFEEWKKRIFK